MLKQINKANTQLMAHCFFCKGETQLETYTKYYNKQRPSQELFELIEQLKK